MWKDVRFKLSIKWLTKFPCFLLSFVRPRNPFSLSSPFYCWLSLYICNSCYIFFLFFPFSSVAQILIFAEYFSLFSHLVYFCTLYPFHSFSVPFLFFLSHTGCLGDFINNSSWCVITLSITSLGENWIWEIELEKLEQGTRGRLHTSVWGYRLTLHKYFLTHQGPPFLHFHLSLSFFYYVFGQIHKAFISYQIFRLEL